MNKNIDFEYDANCVTRGVSFYKRELRRPSNQLLISLSVVNFVDQSSEIFVKIFILHRDSGLIMNTTILYGVIVIFLFTGKLGDFELSTLNLNSWLVNSRSLVSQSCSMSQSSGYPQ